MKVILAKDIKKLGEAGSLVKVANGYARNYLFPQKAKKKVFSSPLVRALILGR